MPLRKNKDSLKTSKAASIYDVARESHVSVFTVSAVVNNKAHVGKKLRERVEAAILKLNYRPNLLARSLAKQKTHTLRMIVPAIANPFFPMVVRGAEDAAQLGRILGAAHDHGEKRVGNGRNNHAERMRFLLREAACQKIGPVIQLEDGGFDALAKFLSNVSLVVDDSGDREYRDVRLPSDVVDACGLARLQRVFVLPQRHGSVESVS